MSTLRQYKQKRNFSRTPEPAARASTRRRKKLSFVVQEHDASHHHFDFRLESDGVLKSWAVPKGPSMDPRHRRLAVMVEDHPLSYGKFEGEIPKGNYGAGTVRIWDKGWYEVEDADEDHGAGIAKGIDSGSVKIVLHGDKLEGSFALVRMNDGKRKNWLLIKHKDTSRPAAPRRSPVVNNKKQMVNVGGEKLQLTNLDKVLWPGEGLTKRDLIFYYNSIREVILPYLKDRPQSLNRHPNGISEKGFYQKNAGGDAPAFVKSIKIVAGSTGRKVDYVICNDEATLAYLNNLGCIEINPWNSRTSHLDQPDYLVIDIDPSPGNTFNQVVDAALAVKEVLDKGKVTGYCKTSGASGVHIYIPMRARYRYNTVRSFAALIAEKAQALVPSITTVERAINKRRGKIYLDYLQNSKGQTLACAYSLRPVPGACVSAPLEWKEVRHGIAPADYTIHNMLRRVKSKGDLFAKVLSGTTDIEKSMRLMIR